MDVAMVFADGSDFGHMGWGSGGWWMVLSASLMLLTVIVAVAVLVRSQVATGTPTLHQEYDPLAGARSILAERFARGELSSEEYRDLVDSLR